jgi:hypothetical protein
VIKSEDFIKKQHSAGKCILTINLHFHSVVNTLPGSVFCNDFRQTGLLIQSSKVDGVQRKLIVVACVSLFLGVFVGCAQKTEEIDLSPQPVQKLSLEEQRAAAYEIFREILVLSDSPEHEKNSPQIKSLYREIIDKYPDIGLAQESYMRLIIMAKEEKTATGDKEAETLYHEFMQQYRDSKIQRIIENELNSNR